MAYADPTTYSKGQINRAGGAVRSGNATDADLNIINTWRASHAYILNTFKVGLRDRAEKHPGVAVAQRLKRLRTIMGKLDRQPKMELARMDDIAGCRWIFPNYKTLKEFRTKYHRAEFQHKLKNDPNKYDYIAKPKSDGYRGIHDIYEYNVGSVGGKRYNGLQLELQYRTIYQHAWATTVEIVGMVTPNQPKFHEGDERHVEFFKLASEIIARTYENSNSCYPDLTDAEVVKKFKHIDGEIRLMQQLKALNASAEQIGARKNVILSLSTDGKLDLFSYAKGPDALRKYFQLERLKNGADIVLVKGDQAGDLRLAYKNYFSDPDDFLKYIQHGCEKLSAKKKKAKKKK